MICLPQICVIGATEAKAQTDERMILKIKIVAPRSVKHDSNCSCCCSIAAHGNIGAERLGTPVGSISSEWVMPVHWIAASTSNYSGRCLCICIYSDIHNALVIILPQREEPPRQHDAARQEKKKEEEEEEEEEWSPS